MGSYNTQIRYHYDPLLQYTTQTLRHHLFKVLQLYEISLAFLDFLALIFPATQAELTLKTISHKNPSPFQAFVIHSEQAYNISEGTSCATLSRHVQITSMMNDVSVHSTAPQVAPLLHNGRDLLYDFYKNQNKSVV